ncbi:hypothetical protein [Pseudoclavibacter endophyticus]|uniref:Uncharacterized protein n=1 Tax=Pseudoclavibacter endophyticus TaxID=1778590 RepID=A0A6H9WP59_9MICO|nr:hypothetical protein [Pseudoclavibacter endophyticus]KAB1648406.1 hypothetical protein F8O04_12030 [Pseudoclavibacter endophyticus]
MSALDGPKQARLLLKEKLDVAHNMLVSGDDLEDAHDLLDAAFWEIDEAVALHDDDLTHFEDGSPVKVTVEIPSEFVSDFYPRIHGDFAAWKAEWEAHRRPRLYPVETS